MNLVKNRPFLTSQELRAILLNSPEKINQLNILLDLALREPDITYFPHGPREVAFLDAFIKQFLSHGYKVVPLTAADESARNEYLGLYFAPVVDLFTYKAIRNKFRGGC